MNRTDQADADRAHLTVMLKRWSGGDAAAGDDVLALVYDRIRQLAAGRLRAAGHAPLQPTELVNELMINLLEADVDWQDRSHFFRTVAVAMRNILHDLGRRSSAVKHGGGQVRVTLGAAEGEASEALGDAEALHEALIALRENDPRKADVIELTYLVGLDHNETAKTLGISLATVNRDLRFGHAWIKQRLAEA